MPMNQPISKHTALIRIAGFKSALISNKKEMALKELTLLLVLISILAALGESRHTHPKSEWAESTEERVIDLENHDAVETDVISIPKTKKWSPMNSILFFKSYNACDEGFQRDYQGICREVWF